MIYYPPYNTHTHIHSQTHTGANPTFSYTDIDRSENTHTMSGISAIHTKAGTEVDASLRAAHKSAQYARM